MEPTSPRRSLLEGLGSTPATVRPEPWLEKARAAEAVARGDEARAVQTTAAFSEMASSS